MIQMGAHAVSAVIPFYGDPTPTKNLIDQLLAERSAHLHEIIVSDDRSPIPFPKTPHITVIRRTRNGGFASAVNSGVAAATGEYVLILNSDLALPDGFIDSILAAAEPWMPAVVAAPLASLTGSTAWSGRHFPTITHQVTEWLLPLARLRHLPALHELVGHDTRADGQHVEIVDWAVGALMLIPRDAYLAVGGMDEGFYMNCEEVDLQRRLRSLGIPTVILGGLAVEHEGGGSSDSARRIGWVMDGRRRYARKWGGPIAVGTLTTAMLGATGVNLLWNAARRLTGTDVHPVETLREQLALVLHPEEFVPEANRSTPPKATHLDR